MTYYIPLLLIYFVLGYRELNHKIPLRQRKVYTLSLLFPIFILVAFRSVNMGNDTMAYFEKYLLVSDFSTFDVVKKYIAISYMEPGFLLLNFFCGKLGMSYFVFQIIVTAYIYYSFYVFFEKYAPNIAMCVCLLMATNMSGTMNVIRMYLALSTLLFAIPFLLKRKWIRFYIIVAIATTFHMSSMVFVFMYPLCAMKYNRIITTSLVLGGGIIAYMGVSFFSWMTNTIDMYENYVSEERFKNMNMLAVTIGFIISVFHYIIAYQSGLLRLSQYKENKKLKGITCISFDYYLHISLLMTLCLSIIGLSNNIMSRVSGYYSIAIPLVLAASLYKYKSFDLRTLLYTIVVGFQIAWFLAIIILRPDWNHIDPYEWGF